MAAGRIPGRVPGLLQGALLHEGPRLVIVAALVGLLASLAAIGFHNAIVWLSGLAYGGPSVASATYPFWARAVMPAIGLVLSGLILRAGRETGEAVPEIMEMVSEGGGRVPAKTGAVKTLASWITLGMGGSAGREGPSVAIGSTLGSVIGRRLKVGRATQQTLVACGTAAAIAASFNAPIAAVLFAMEVLLGSGVARTFTPLVVASVTGTLVSRALVGDDLAFHVPAYALVSAKEIPTYAVLGLLAGGLARLFIWGFHEMTARLERLKVEGPARWAGAGLALGLLGLAAPGVLGNGYDTVEAIFRGQVGFGVLIALLLLKPLATSLTFGAGGAGGVFAPTLFMGAVLGALVGGISAQLFPTWTAPVGAYALVGMAAMLASATQAPIMAILFLVEMTGDYAIVLPVMLASGLGVVVASAGGAESIYTAGLVRKGKRLRRGRQSEILGDQTVDDLMRAPPVPVLRETPIETVMRRVVDDRQDYVYVADAKGVLMGVVSLGDLRGLLRNPGAAVGLQAHHIMVGQLATVAPDAPLSDVARMLDRNDLERLPVVDNDGHLAGVVLRRDLLALLSRTILADSSLGIEFVSGNEEGLHRDYVAVPPGHRVEVIPVPAPWVGRSLREMSLRARFGANVVAVRLQGARGVLERLVPDPDQPLTKGETLVVTGSNADLRRLLAEAHAGPERREDPPS